jgi:hypothetical protein
MTPPPGKVDRMTERPEHDELVRQPPRSEHENNLLTADALDWCERHYGTDNPSVDVMAEAVVAVLFGREHRLQ